MPVIALDLDGTLLRSDETVSLRSLKVLQMCREKGYRIVIATARPPRYVRVLLPRILQVDASVVCNGALVYQGDQCTEARLILVESLQSILEWFGAVSPDCPICLEIEDRLYSNVKLEDIFGVQWLYELVDYRVFALRPAAKVIVDLSRGPEVEEIKRNLPSDCHLLVTDGGQIGQIMCKGVSKASGVKTLLNQWGLSMEDVISFGDDHNDIEIIRESGLGVAMANADAQVKAVAQRVTLSNDEDGVAVVLQELVAGVGEIASSL